MNTNAAVNAGHRVRRHPEASPWAALLAAHRAALARSQKLGRAYLAAEKTVFAAKRERRLVPAPVELVLGERLPALLRTDGKTKILRAAQAELASEQAIPSFFANDSGLLSERRSALARWRAAQEAADAETGYSAALEAEDAAHKAWIEAQDEADRTLHEVLRFPTAGADKIAAKRALLDSNPCIDQMVELRMIVDAVLAAGRRT